MPRIRLTKTAIDALPTSKSDVVYWDAGYPGFGVKVTPKGRKVFIVLYRTGGASSLGARIASRSHHRASS
jgi:Arm DNA-binding domain